MAETLALRTVGIAASVAALILVFQVLRAASILPGEHLPIALAARLAALSTPALLALTLPMGLLISAGLGLAELRVRGELVGWRALGLSDWLLLRGVALVACMAMVLTGALTGWLGPLGLDRAQTSLVTAWRAQILATLSPSELQPVAGGHWLAGASAPAKDGSYELRDLTWRRVDIDSSGVEVRAAAAHVTLEDTVHLALKSVRIAAADETSCTVIEAERLDTDLPLQTAGAGRIVPEIETSSVVSLWEGDLDHSLAQGQLFKRFALVLLPPALLVLLASLVLGTRLFGSPGRGALLGLLLATCVHLGARSAELAGREQLSLGVAVLGAMVVCVLACAAWYFNRGAGQST